jgi:suppressor of ftsI
MGPAAQIARMMGTLLSGILVGLALLPGDPCAGPGLPVPHPLPAPDLYCIPLMAGAAGGTAQGAAHLLPAPTPFGIAVTRDGLPRLRVRIQAQDLPRPEDLGPYTRFVAWMTPPTLHPMIALGSLEEGELEATVEGFNSYLLLISAEGEEIPEARTGPLVLRGTSPTMVLRPHDMAHILAEMSMPADGHEPLDPHPHGDAQPDTGDGIHGGHGAQGADGGHGAHLAELPAGGDAEWVNPPMHPLISMPHQMMALRPRVRPFLPVGGAPGSPRVDVAPSRELQPAQPRETLHLAEGDTLDLVAGPLLRDIGGRVLPGYGFNGQSPGPLLEGEVSTTVHIRFRNDTPLPAAVHWHGIRLDAPYDGVPGVTQAPVPPGGEFLYELRLPDEGSFWYHPHLREDVAQDLGLSGNFRVRPATEPGDAHALYAPVEEEIFLILDDHLVTEDGRGIPYGREAPTHALMGRFGNVLLANGSAARTERVQEGDVVRFHFTNAASTRTFNLSFGDLPMKVVASDVGKLPREAWVQSVVLAPAERWVVEVRFPEAGAVALENRVQALDHVGARFFLEVDTVAMIHVASSSEPSSEGHLSHAPSDFSQLRVIPSLVEETDNLLAAHAGQPPHRTLVLDLRTRDLPFPLDPLLMWESVYRPPVEWSGTMPDMDWLITGREAEWILRDADTGAENMDIDWRFRQGDRIRLRLVNNRNSLHPMQHPIHLHGQRFMVLSVNGEASRHPAWKDTVLVPVGTVVDLLLELDNPGPWMLHCHISEHLESGMMTVIQVDP